MAFVRILSVLSSAAVATIMLLVAALAQAPAPQAKFEEKIDALSKEVEQLAVSAAEELAASSTLETLRARALEIASELQDVASELAPEAEKLQRFTVR